MELIEKINNFIDNRVNEKKLIIINNEIKQMKKNENIITISFINTQLEQMQIKYPENLKEMQINIDLEKNVCVAYWIIRLGGIYNINKQICVCNYDFIKSVIDQLYVFFEITTRSEYKYDENDFYI